MGAYTCIYGTDKCCPPPSSKIIWTFIHITCSLIDVASEWQLIKIIRYIQYYDLWCIILVDLRIQHYYLKKCQNLTVFVCEVSHDHYLSTMHCKHMVSIFFTIFYFIGNGRHINNSEDDASIEYYSLGVHFRSFYTFTILPSLKMS